MSDNVETDPTKALPPTTPKSKKNKKKKGAKNKTNGDTVGISGDAPKDAEGDDAPEEASVQETPVNGTNKAIGDDSDGSEDESVKPSIQPKDVDAAPTVANGSSPARDEDDTKARFDALVQDRDNLRAEVTELRKSLEELQQKHQTELSTLQEQLEETQGEKDHAETQYRNLLGKVNTIKSQLGERLKADAEELAQTRSRIEELEQRNTVLEQEASSKTEELSTLTNEFQAQSKELSSLRNRTTLSQQNWVKEREEMMEQEAYLREEFESAKQAMHDWEVLAMEERSIRRGLEDKSTDLEEQVSHFKEAFDKAARERDTQALAVEGLQKALQDIQDARKQELRELVESSQKEEEALRKQLQDAEKSASEAKIELETAKAELERALPFEKEVKEKNLLIGKLRHEAVILNDHLTKALRFLKKGRPEDNVDRQIVTNHFLHFLALDRSDPKKFQILQLIAALLNWNEEQREQAGLARPGTSSGAHPSASTTNLGLLRTPLSPFHRTPSTPSLIDASYYYSQDSTTSPVATKESLADLWQNFLEQEAQQGAAGGIGPKSRSSSLTVPKIVSPPPGGVAPKSGEATGKS